MNHPNSSSLIVGILQVSVNPWKKIYLYGQKPTWIAQCPPNIQIINLFGNPPGKISRRFDIVHEKLRWSPTLQGPIHRIDSLVGNFLRKKINLEVMVKKDDYLIELFVNFPSTHLTLPNVELALFKYFIEETDAEFLYMTNTSSYVNLENLNSLIKDFPKSKVYGGSMQNFAKIPYASGANRIVSRDLVKVLIENFNTWDYQFVEDVSMGKILINESYIKKEIPSITVRNPSEIKILNENQLRNTAHFRMKSGSLKSRNDAELMKLLHERLLTI